MIAHGATSFGFDPRPRGGGDAIEPRRIRSRHRFDPRPRGGGDIHAAPSNGFLDRVSIRAPGEGATGGGKSKSVDPLSFRSAPPGRGRPRAYQRPAR